MNGDWEEEVAVLTDVPGRRMGRLRYETVREECTVSMRSIYLITGPQRTAVAALHPCKLYKATENVWPERVFNRNITDSPQRLMPAIVPYGSRRNTIPA